MSLFVYLKHFIQDKHVASIAPTSQIAVERICKNVPWEKARVVVEYGAGSGVFTRHILGKLGSDGVLIAFELNAELAELLQQSIKDPRCIVVHRSAEHIIETLDDLCIPDIDIIISGIPFSFLSERMRERIVKRTWSALKAGGLFITYQAFPKPPSGKRPLRRLIAEYFGEVFAEYEFRNIPPLEVLCAMKECCSYIERIWLQKHVSVDRAK